MTRAWAYVIGFPGNNPPPTHPPHTLSATHSFIPVSSPASWLFLEKAFLATSAELGLLPDYVHESSFTVGL